MAKPTRLRGPFCFVVLCVAAICIASAYGDSDERLEPRALDYAGIYRLKQIEPNLTGSDLNIGVVCRSITYLDGVPQNDYQPNIAHGCFKPEQFTFHDDGKTPAGISEHSTAICSILFGNDQNSTGEFVYQGALSKAQAQVYEFWHFLKNYVFPNTKPNADIVTVSVGSPFEDWWSRGINALAEQHGLIVIAGIGNGLLAHDPPLYPAAGDNCLAVGLAMPITDDNPVGECNGFSLAQATTSSCGPTDDMRCKPDIIAPGNCLVADSEQLDAYKASGSYSSFATPVVTSVAGLLIQKAKADPNLIEAVSAQGGNCVVKAILMNSAKKMPYWHKGRVQKDDDHTVPLDWMQGAGMVDAIAAHRTLTSGRGKAGNVAKTGWDLGELSQQASAAKTYRFKVGYPKGHKITATVVWNRHYQQNYPFEKLDEKDVDIKLELWAIDAENPQTNYLLDYSNSKVDNVEHIYCKADPNYTDYEIVVSYADEPNAPAHNYGLAWSVNNPAPNNKNIWLDINTDGQFDNKDVAIVLKNVIEFARQSTDYLLGDVNEDGAIDFNDARIFMDELRAAAEIKTASNQE